MRKMIVLMAILVLCLYFGQARADEAKAKASAETNVGIFEDDHSSVDTFEKRQFPYTALPTFVGTPFTQIQKGKYFIFYTQLDKEFSVESIEMMRKKISVQDIVFFKWLKRHVRTSLREKPLPENQDPIHLLNWDPEIMCHPGDKEIAETVINGDYPWKPWPFIAVLGEGLKDLKKKSHTRRIVVYVQLSEKAVADGLAVGTGGAAGKTLGPVGQKADNVLGILTAGAMIGSTELSMENFVEIRMRALNDGPIKPPVLPQKEEPVAKVISSPPQRQEVEVKIKIEAPSPVAIPSPMVVPKEEKVELPEFVVYFDFDKAEIKPAEMEKIKQAAVKLKNIKSPYQLEGHTCIIGTRIYNVGLGLRRAEAVDEALKKEGVRPEQLASLGEGKPADENLEKNRRVIIRFIGPASGK